MKARHPAPPAPWYECVLCHRGRCWEVDHRTHHRTTHWVPCQWEFTCSTPEFPRSSLPPSMFHSREEERLWTVRQAGPQDPARGQYLWSSDTKLQVVPQLSGDPSRYRASLDASAAALARLPIYSILLPPSRPFSLVRYTLKRSGRISTISRRTRKTARRPDPIISRMASVGARWTLNGKAKVYAFSPALMYGLKASRGRTSYPLRKVVPANKTAIVRSRV